MSHNIFTRIIAVFLSITIALTIVPQAAFAEADNDASIVSQQEDPALQTEQDQDSSDQSAEMNTQDSEDYSDQDREISTENESETVDTEVPEDKEEAFKNNQNTPPEDKTEAAGNKDGEDAEPSSGEYKDIDTEEDPDVDTQEDTDGPDIDTQESTKATSGSIEIHAVSGTKNIVGDAFVNAINQASKDPVARELSLKKYPMEDHDLSWYGDSPRVRPVEGGDEEGPNYLVYRDSFIIIPVDDVQYTLLFSEDNETAYISPAIDAEELLEKTGIVFVREDIENDDILVFEGQPSYEGDTMIVPLKKTEDIAANELFSDGKLAVEPSSQDDGQNSRRGLLKSQAEGLPFDYNKNVKGTNWKGEITSFKPSWPSAGANIDVMSLVFELQLNMKFDLGFKITTSGDSNGRETAKIASVDIPLELFSASVDYNLQVEFDSTPLEMEGTLTTEFSYTLGFGGANIKKFRTPVRLSKLTINGQSASYYNKDINFYIGSQLRLEGGFLSVSIPLIGSIGPVLSINQNSRGGCYFTAKHERDQFRDSDRGSKAEIHTCTKQGKEGCLSILATEKNQISLEGKIDLLLKEKSFKVVDSGENAIDSKRYYNSYTYNSGIKEGDCPHKVYKVPVRVWADELKNNPANNCVVTTGDITELDPDTKELAKDVTDQEGKAVLYLPYKENFRYTLTASRTEGDATLAGSAQQPEDMAQGGNQNVDIILKSELQTNVHISHQWDIDVDEKDRPESLNIKLQKRNGSSGQWEDIKDAVYEVTDDNYAFDYTGDKYTIADGALTLTEYRAVLSDISDTEESATYATHRVNAYTSVASEAEPAHDSLYYVEYNTTNQDNITYCTITETAVAKVTINKKWNLSDENNKAESVYLALQQMPAEGWGDKADEQGLANAWTAATNPIEGEAATISRLKEEGILTMEAMPSGVDVPLAIGKVSDENNWSITYTIPKYKKGIKMQFMASELDETVIEQLMLNEYNSRILAEVESSDKYSSKSGYAFREYSDYEYTANVLNTDDDEHTISGTVSWVYKTTENADKRDVTIKVHKSDGTQVGKVELKAEDHPDSDVWTWSLTDENILKDNVYYIEEEIADNSSRLKPKWLPVVNGLDAANYWLHGPNPAITVKAIFEGATETDTLPPFIGMKIVFPNSSIDNLRLTKDRDYVFSTQPITNQVDSIQLDDVEGWVKEAKEPVLSTSSSFGGSILTYTFVYRRQSEAMTLHIDKQWYKDHDEDYQKPETVEVDVFRDSENIGTVILSGEHEWSADVTADKNSIPLKRLADDGHKYEYTIKEKEIEGFTPSIQKPEDNPSTLRFTLTNSWVGQDNVTVKGTITWEDENNKRFRPEKVRLSVLNSRKEYVRSVEVAVNGNGSYEAKYLPAKDAEGNPLSYSVLQDHVNGYTTSYSEPQYNETTKIWTCNVTNKLTGYYPIKIKKTITGDKPGNDDTYTFNIEPVKASVGNEEIPLPRVDGKENENEITITGEKEKTAEFLLDEDGLYYYTIQEEKGTNESCNYDTEVRQLMIARATDSEGKVNITSYLKKGEDNGKEDLSEQIDTVQLKEPATIEFTNNYPKKIEIEKKWDIDLEGKDRPDSIEVVVQQKKGDKWETIKLVELNKDNDWKTETAIEELEGNNPEIRVRELKEETALQKIVKEVKEKITSYSVENYDSCISEIKEKYGDYYNMLPDDVKKAADQGADKLKEKLKTTEEDLYDKLLEKIGIASSLNRIVYDEEDKEHKDLSDEAKKKKSNEANAVTYHVDKYTSAINAGEVDAHVTKYKVDYEKEKDKDEYTITNKAIVEIDTVKRWLSFGVDDKDMPESVWLVLMCKPEAGAVDKAKDSSLPEAGDVSNVMDYEFPVINPEEGGMDPITLLGQLAIGVDLSFISKYANKLFGIKIPELAVAKVTKDDDWKAEFVDSKYTFGILKEYKGAELSSEIIRQIIKYVTHINIPISYNPFDNYISIPTKAFKSIEGITNPGDLLDLSKLGGIALEKAKSLTMDDIKNFSVGTLLSDYHLMANVINIKIDWDSKDDDKITVEGKKSWVGDDDNKDNTRPDHITIRLKANGEEVEGENGSKEITEDDDWKWSFTDLPRKDDKGEEIKYTITEDVVEDYTSKVDGYNVTNTYTPDKTQVNVEKKWDDGDNADGIRPDSVEVKLMKKEKNDSEYTDTEKTLTLSENNQWSGSFTDIASKGDGGDRIEYTVEEVPITGNDGAELYTSTVTGTAATGFTITNSYTPENIIISGHKVWDDDNNRDHIRPDSVTVYLLANEQRVKNEEGQDVFAQASKEGDWKFFFPSQPKTDQSGNSITYSVEEEYTDVITSSTDGPGKYASAITGTAENGFTITNTHTPEKVTINGQKTWEGEDENHFYRPERITIRLKANGEDVEGEKGSKTVSKDDHWEWSFADLPKNDENGKEIEYTITEDRVENYTSTITEEPVSDPNRKMFKVTNIFTPGETQVRVRKRWDDNDNQDGIRPNSVNVKLLYQYEGMEKAEETGKILTLSEANGWAGRFTGLADTKDGKTINYTVLEQTTDVITGRKEQGGEDGPGKYITEIHGDASGGYTLTNRHIPETVTIRGEKIWEDDNNDNNTRPQNIVIRLRANGEEYKTLAVSEDENHEWKWQFKDLPKYRYGKEIRYTVSEDAVEGYTTTVTEEAVSEDDPNQRMFKVTNTYIHIPEKKTQINVTKVWDDGDDHDEIRPKSVTIQLLADGESTGRTLRLSEQNSWTGSFDDLPVEKGGQELRYTVTEMKDDVVTGKDTDKTYGIKIKGDAQSGFVVTNTHTPSKISFDVKKVWDDADDRDGLRPDSVTVELKRRAEGSYIYNDTGQTIVLNEKNDWTGSFKGLEGSPDGGLTRYYYWVKEVYTDVINGKDEAGTYKDTITGDDEKGYIITNTHTPQTVKRTIKKEWNDNNDQDEMRPDKLNVTLEQVMYDSQIQDYQVEDISTFELNGDNGWTASAEDLPLYKNGNKIRYYWREDDTDGYGLERAAVVATSAGGENVTFTNTHVQNLAACSVGIRWEDADNNDGLRPNYAQFHLLGRNGTPVEGQSATLSENSMWTSVELPYLPVNDSEGKINYTWKAPDFQGYTHYSYTEGNHTQFVYVHEPERCKVEVCKIFNDADDQDGIRPDSITVNLYEGKDFLGTGIGKTLVDSVELSEDDAKEVSGIEGKVWYYSWDLPRYKDRRQLTWSIEEEPSEDYETEISDPEDLGDGLYRYEITNTHEPARKDINVIKQWQDNDDRDGFRPDTVTVKLLEDGEDTGRKLVLSQENAWKGSFDGLDERKAGQDIFYTVEEVKTDVVTGEDGPETYSCEVAENPDGGYIITNTHTPVTVTKMVKKVWLDNLNNDNVRPDNLKVTLHAMISSSQPTEDTDFTLNLDNNWTATAENLPQYKDGKKIRYYWTEEDIKDIQGNDLYGLIRVYEDDEMTVFYNMLNAKTVELSCGIEWDDSDNNDGLRPDDLMFNLFEEYTGPDGETVKREVDNQGALLSEEHGWESVKLMSLPAYRNGSPIQYTWEPAQEVAGYGSYSYTNGNHTQFVYWHYPALESIEVCKIWDDADDQDGVRPEKIKVNLYEESEGSRTLKDTAVVTREDVKTISGIDGEVWYCNWSFLPMLKDGKNVSYSIEEEPVDGYSTDIPRPEVVGDELYRYTITNTHTVAKKDIKVSKQWVDADNSDGFRPDSVTVKLLADGEDTGKKLILSEDNGWEGSFQNLDVRKSGKDIKYTVDETKTNIITGEDGARTYSCRIEGNPEEGFTITNTHTPVAVSRAFKKVWDDDNNKENSRPGDLKVTLHKRTSESEPEKVGDFTLNADNEWQMIKEDLPQFMDGRKISYYWTEEDADGYETARVEVSADEDNENGETTTFTNTHNPEYVDVSVGIEWDDDDNLDRIRPDRLALDLYANGQKVEGASTVLTRENNWKSQTAMYMPAYENGRRIQYEWRPSEKVSGYGSYFYTIGTHTQLVYWHYSDYQNIQVCKIWKDADDQDGVRPESIKVYLYEKTEDSQSSEEPVDTVELTRENAAEVTDLVVDGEIWTGEVWTYVWNQPTHRDGKKLTYSIGEDHVEGYEPVISEPLETGENYYRYIIANTHTPAQTKIKVTKKWADDNNRDGIRPKSVTVKLLADGKDTGKTLELSDSNNWTGSFSKLDVYKAGKTVEYTVEETKDAVITGTDAAGTYASAITGDAEKGFVITNTHTSAKVDVEGSKTWDDNDNQAGSRPESITIHLMNGNSEIARKTVTQADGWKWKFTQVPANEAGKKISYTVLEDAVEGYTATVSGMNVTNRLNTSDPDKKQYTITYDLNGGSYDDSEEDITETYDEGTKISIHAAPERDGYEFTYWKGSSYQPGDSYTVTGDHTFTAQWKKDTDSDDSDDSDEDKTSSKKKTTPKTSASTGDHNDILPWIILALSSSLLIFLYFARLILLKHKEE